MIEIVNLDDGIHFIVKGNTTSYRTLLQKLGGIYQRTPGPQGYKFKLDKLEQVKNVVFPKQDSRSPSPSPSRSPSRSPSPVATTKRSPSPHRSPTLSSDGEKDELDDLSDMNLSDDEQVTSATSSLQNTPKKLPAKLPSKLPGNVYQRSPSLSPNIPSRKKSSVSKSQTKSQPRPNMKKIIPVKKLEKQLYDIIQDIKNQPGYEARRLLSIIFNEFADMIIDGIDCKMLLEEDDF